jgi:hypothetical protein
MKPFAPQAAGATIADAIATGRASGLALSISIASAKANLLEVRTTCAHQESEWGFLAKSKNFTESSRVTTTFVS